MQDSEYFYMLHFYVNLYRKDVIFPGVPLQNSIPGMIRKLVLFAVVFVSLFSILNAQTGYTVSDSSSVLSDYADTDSLSNSGELLSPFFIGSSLNIKTMEDSAHTLYRSIQEDSPALQISLDELMQTAAVKHSDSAGAAISITEIPAGGILKFAGDTVSAGSIFPCIPSDKFFFYPDSNVYGTAIIRYLVKAPGTIRDTFSVIIKILPAADLPSVTQALTYEDLTSDSGLVIKRSRFDGPEIAYFKISEIRNGRLFLKDGFTEVKENDFIPAAPAAEGLRFRPAANFYGSGSFLVQAALDSSDLNAGRDTARAVITVIPVNDPPEVFNAMQTRIYTEGDSRVVYDSITVRDVDDNETIIVTLNLVHVNTGSIDAGISAIYDRLSGVCSFSGSVDKINSVLKKITFIPEKDNELSTYILVRVRDAAGSGPLDGVLTAEVIPVNDQPTLSHISFPPIIYSSPGSQKVKLSGISAGGGENQKLTISAESSNPELTGVPAVEYRHPSSSASLVFCPADNTTGQAWIRVTVTDDGFISLSKTDSFLVTIKHIPGNGLVFDGTDYAIIPYSTVLNTSTFTVEMWIKPDENSPGEKPVLYSKNDHQGFRLRITNDNKWEFSAGTGKLTRSVVSKEDVIRGAWNHIAASCNSKELRLYINGIRNGQVQLNYSKNKTAPVLIATAEPEAADEDELFRGIIDELRFWNYCRSDEQIRSGMFALQNTDASGLAGCYRFEQISGDRIYNLISSSPDGMIKGVLGKNYWSDSYAMVRPEIKPATNTEPNGFSANWNIPGFGTPPMNYYLTVDDDRDFSSPVEGYNNLNVGESLSYFVDGLPGGRIYYYRVSASAGPMTGRSCMSDAAVLAEPLPAELSSFSADVSGSSVELVWTAASDGKDMGFQVERARADAGYSAGWTKAGFIGCDKNSSAMKDYSLTDRNLPAGRYMYRLKQISENGKVIYLGELEVDVTDVPGSFALFQNYPNPFYPVTTIKYALPEDCNVRLQIFNILGKEIGTIVDEVRTAGYHEVSWNGSNNPPGTYYYSIIASSVSGGGVYKAANKMVLVK